MPDPVDWTTYTTPEIELERDRLFAELETRHNMATAEDRVDDLNRAYLAARGVRDGDPWVQPVTPAEAYPRGWTVTHDDSLWVSTVSANMNTPGQPGWEPADAA